MISYFDAVQIVGAIFIIAGYWLMASSVKWASLALVLGCAVWAYWATLVHPFALWMLLLELLLGAMSARTFWINRKGI